VTRSVQVQINDEMATFAAQSWLRDHLLHRIPGGDISSAPN